MHMTNLVGSHSGGLECGGGGGGGVLNVYLNRASAPGHKNHMDISYCHNTTNLVDKITSYIFLFSNICPSVVVDSNPMSDDIMTLCRVELPVHPIHPFQ